LVVRNMISKNPDRARKINHTLKHLLSENDSEALDLVKKERAVLIGMFGKPAFADFERAVEKYDFQKALVFLKNNSRTGTSQT